MYFYIFIQHVVTEVDMGIRSGENFEEESSSFVDYASQEVALFPRSTLKRSKKAPCAPGHKFDLHY